MKKIFILGEKSIKDELRKMFGSKCEVYDEINNTIDIIIDSTNYPKQKKKENIEYIDKNITGSVPFFTSSLCVPVSEQSTFSKYPKRLIGIGLYDTFSEAKLLEIASSKITDIKIFENAESFLKETGINYVKVPDRTGLVFPRILSMIINEAAQVYSENIASKEDIDTAMKLGTSYPFGPLEWADRLGIDLVYNILSSLQNEFGEARYRPHPSLKEMINLKQTGVKTGKGFYIY